MERSVPMESGLNYIHDVKKEDRLLLIPLMFIPCIFVLLNDLDNDIWFLLNHGRYVLEKGIPHIEPFTIHQGFQFVMQQWLSSVIFWITYSSLGEFGIKLLVMLCYGLAVFMIYKICMKISDNYFFISFSISVFSAIPLLFFMISRPYIFSTLIFIIELYLLESFILSNNKKYLYFLPLLSVLLINIQASMWPMLFVILIPYIIDSFKFKMGPLDGQGYNKKPLILMICAMIILGFLNPYGIDAMTYLFKSYGVPQINNIVSEMQPADIKGGLGKFFYASMLILVLIYSVYRKGSTKLRYVLLMIGTAYLTISSIRGFIFFIICGFFPLAYYLKDFKFKGVKNESTKKTLVMRKILIGMIILLISAIVYQGYKSNGLKGKEYTLLNNTINFILERKGEKEIKLYTGFDDGCLAEFKGIPSYMDTRAEVFLKKNNKKADILKEYYDLQAGSIYYKDVLDKYQFTHLIVQKKDILYTYLQRDDNYKITYSNEKYTLYERKHPN